LFSLGTTVTPQPFINWQLPPAARPIQQPEYYIERVITIRQSEEFYIADIQLFKPPEH
jgi:hypothetical protein